MNLEIVRFAEISHHFCELKLNGQPWAANAANDYMHARHLMCLLLGEFAALGWRPVCSADCSAKFLHHQNGPDYPMDVHCWFLTKTDDPKCLPTAWVYEGDQTQATKSR